MAITQQTTSGSAAAPQAATIAWSQNFDAALEDARKRQRHVLLDFSAAPM